MFVKLSGGLRLIAQKLSSGLTTGSFPVECYMSLDRKKQIKKYDKTNVYPADGRQRFSDENLIDLSVNLDTLLTQPSDAGSRVTRSKGLIRFYLNLITQTFLLQLPARPCHRQVARGNNNLVHFFIQIVFPLIPPLSVHTSVRFIFLLLTTQLLLLDLTVSCRFLRSEYDAQGVLLLRQ